MVVVLKSLDQSPEYTVAAGDTLTTIAAANCPDFDAATIARLNWGAVLAPEIARALIETVGVRLVDAPVPADVVDAATLRLDPAEGVNAKIRLPAKAEIPALKPETAHVLKLRKPLAANVVEVASLDRWFIPEKETCDIGYKALGAKQTANKLHLNVFGSKYCDFTPGGDAFGGYTESAELEKTPLFKQEQADLAAGAAAVVQWTGESTAADGMLKPEAADKKRYVNVAFSPYTAHLRYFKNDADKDARLILLPFWPAWDKDDARIDDSFKVKWKIADSGGKLKQGLLTIVDGADRPVFRKALKDSDLSDGEHECVWPNGAYAAGVMHGGKVAATMTEGPYRARIEAHKPAHELEGLALAAMHSEVRIYVHKDTLHPEKADYKAIDDASSLLYAIAPLNHKDADLDPTAEENLWLREKLAATGFHAGPVVATAPEDHLKRALSDLKRSVPKVRPGGTGDYLRIDDAKVPTTHLDQCKAVLTAMIDDTDGYKRYRRPWFGKPADRKDFPDNFHADVRARLQDPAKELVVWVDDRHFYTTATWADGDNPTGQPKHIRDHIKDHGSTPAPQRGGWMDGDVKIDYDLRDIERPWIPVQVQPLLMKKARKLSDATDYAAEVKDDADLLAAMRRAIGPVRIDWTFDEIDGDYDGYDQSTDDVKVTVPELDPTMWGQHSRSGPAVLWTLHKEGVEHTRKDVKRKSVYHNAPAKVKGIRPTGAATDYYQAPFGKTGDDGVDKHLIPFANKPDPARETIATVVHDDMGPKQPADQKFTKRRGVSGVYFTPSIMAGDGYRLRAQVRFDRTVGYAFPNAEILEKRYPRPPQAHSAKLRLWRKSSVRANVQWASESLFAARYAAFKSHFAMAHVHYVSEDGADTPPTYRPSDLFPPPGAGLNADYLAMAKLAVKPTSSRMQTANISFNDNRVWPWNEMAHFGQQAPVADAATPRTAAWTLFTSGEFDQVYTALTIHMALTLSDRIERKYGSMRGNTVLEMTISDDVYYMNYECDGCNKKSLYYEREQANLVKKGTNCTHCASPDRKLRITPRIVGFYNCGVHAKEKAETSMNGGRFHNTPCDEPGCVNLLQGAGKNAVEYECNKCGKYKQFLRHSPGHHVAADCPRACGGKLYPTGDYVKSQDYSCPHCGVTAAKVNTGNVKDFHVGAAHPCLPLPPPQPGQPAPPPRPAVPAVLAAATPANEVYDFTTIQQYKWNVEVRQEAEFLRDTMPGSSLGLPVGLSVNFKASFTEKYKCDQCNIEMGRDETTLAGGDWDGKLHTACASTPKGALRRMAPAEVMDDNPRLWAHEVSHNHSLSHAANAGGASNPEHDATAISLTTPFAPVDATTGANWDRACLMSYANHQRDFDLQKDKPCMCFRCILRTRGWKVTPLANPPTQIGRT